KVSSCVTAPARCGLRRGAKENGGSGPPSSSGAAGCSAGSSIGSRDLLLNQRRACRSTPAIQMSLARRNSRGSSSRLPQQIFEKPSTMNEEWSDIPSSPSFGRPQPVQDLLNMAANSQSGFLPFKKNLLAELVEGRAVGGSTPPHDPLDRVRSTGSATVSDEPDECMEGTRGTRDSYGFPIEDDTFDEPPKHDELCERDDDISSNLSEPEEEKRPVAPPMDADQVQTKWLPESFPDFNDVCPSWLSSLLKIPSSLLFDSFSSEHLPAVKEEVPRHVSFSIKDDIVECERTPEDIKNSWNKLDVPRTLRNMGLISRVRGISVSYSDAAHVPGKTCMVHMEPAPLIGALTCASDRHRTAVLAEQERQRKLGVVDVEELGRVAARHSEWGVNLTMSTWWLER
ncbi:hypothetical protein ACHAWF_003968, partial [Thalassiosira exigua]